MESTNLTHLSDADLLELENLLKKAENRGGFSDRINNNFKNDSTYDLKFAYHTVRLMNEVEQILIECDLDLQRNREQLKTIRRGEWTLDQLEAYFTNKEHALETAYANSKLPNVPKEDAIKKLLMESLEAHYGSLTSAVVVNPDIKNVLSDLQQVIERYTK